MRSSDADHRSQRVPSTPHLLWVVVDRWLIEDGMVPRLAVGQKWKTRLRLLLTDAVEVESSARPRLQVGRGPRLSPTPTYEVVGRICPHPWDGWHILDTGPVSFVARDESREFPANAMVRTWSPLLVDPNQWDDALIAANPRGWRRWLVRRVLEAPAFAEANAIYVELEAADVS